MTEFLALTRRLDGIDGWIQKLIVKFKVLRFYRELRARLREQKRAFGMRITNGELFDMACLAYWELFVVDGSLEGAVYTLRTKGLPSISAEMIVMQVAQHCPKGQEIRLKDEFLFSPLPPIPTLNKETTSCGG